MSKSDKIMKKMAKKNSTKRKNSNKFQKLPQIVLKFKMKSII